MLCLTIYQAVKILLREGGWALYTMCEGRIVEALYTGVLRAGEGMTTCVVMPTVPPPPGRPGGNVFNFLFVFLEYL